MTNLLDNYVAAYERKSPFDFDNEILLNWYPQRIVSLAGNRGTILELGLGHGFSTNLFSQNFERHVVLEGSSAVIDNFRKLYPACKAELVETYFETFDTEERFDLIVMGFILEHVDDPVDIMKRFGKFLKPGGQMFIAVPNAEVLNRRFGQAMGMLPDIAKLSDYDLLLGHKRYYTVDSLRNDVAAAGYAVENMEGIFLKPLTSQQLQSLHLEKGVLDAMCQIGIDYPELSCGILSQIRACT
ncbi:class I SAM-dependent methyltransferase [Herbaspirillum sp. NPDC087042]|uniref:class I SAM-dependent methyltransferase n=1 Tax=Herbaspirillum sp. NPDC087042 TaxID=3364004 RepID=UPI003830BFDE